MKKEETKKLPTHVAIIMDGNGRWAKKRLLPRAMGHSAGADNVEKICKAAWDLGVKYLAKSKQNIKTKTAGKMKNGSVREKPTTEKL